MDVKEKLVELLLASLRKHIHKSCKLAENIADDLIAHGVTAQEWFSVKDRLPEVGKYVLTYCEANKNKYACGEYSDTYKGFFINNFWNGDITHWCYLPQPPKGE